MGMIAVKHIADNVFGVFDFFGFLNMYIIDTGAGLALVDTGIGERSVRRLEKALRADGYTLDDIRHILITHFHADHTGGLSILQERIDVPTYAHHLEAPYIRGDAPPVYADPDTLRGVSRRMYRSLQQELKPARVDVEVRDGQKLNRVLPNLQVIHLPGHSPGQAGYYLPESRILIGGDVMFSLPFGLRMPFRAPSPDWEAAKQSVRRVARMDVLVLCVGHGRPRLGNADIPVEKLVKRIGGDSR